MFAAIMMLTGIIILGTSTVQEGSDLSVVARTLILALTENLLLTLSPLHT